MKSSSAKKASISLPDGLDREIKKLARQEHRTLSGILQEAARFYLSTRRFEELQREVTRASTQRGVQSEDDVDEAVHALRREHS